MAIAKNIAYNACASVHAFSNLAIFGSNRSMQSSHILKLMLFGFFLLVHFAHTIIADEDDINWEQASTEVDSLPYSKEFIDSLKCAYNYSPDNRSLRTLKKIPVTHETLVYEVGWGPFKAGYVILLIDFNKSDNTIRLGGKALSNNFISAFYKMRDYVISTIDADGLYPIFFEQHLREGKKYKADRWMLYDNILGKLHMKEKKIKTIDAPKFTHDYLSMLYYVRSKDIAVGDKFTLNTYTDSKIHPIHFSCKEKKKVEIESGVYNCLVIEPKLAGDGDTFNKRDKLEVFISDDVLRIPILIKSKIKFGSITAKLIWHNSSNKPHNPAE